VVLLGLTGLVSLVTLFHDLSGFGLIESAELGTLTAVDANDYDATTQTLAGAYAAFFIATAVAYLAWLSRSVDNVPKLTGSVPMVTPRWSIGWWFIPLANLVKPYQVVEDLNDRMASPPQPARNGLVLVWWIVWLIGGVAGAILVRLPAPGTLEELGGWFTANVLVDVLSVAAAALAIAVVLQIQTRADARAGAVATLDSSAAPVGGDPQRTADLPPCPRCGSPREAGQRLCPSCGLDLWAAYDQEQGR
jgi:hypothetical protein